MTTHDFLERLRRHPDHGITFATPDGERVPVHFHITEVGHLTAVHPRAIKALAEIGIDISANTSKHLDTVLNQDVETVITVGGNADQACPVFPGQVNRHHDPFDDPARAEGSKEEQMGVFRRVRDEIQRVFSAWADGRLGQH